MSKVIQAVNAMLSKKELISNVLKSGNEFFFLYKNIYKWSIHYRETDDDYVLYFYPGHETLNQLASLNEELWNDINMIVYHSRDLGGKEAHDTLKELYMTLKEMLYGVDKVLEDIISDF